MFYYRLGIVVMKNVLLCFENKRSKHGHISTYKHLGKNMYFPSSRFDYSGIGNSDGNLAECTVGKWRKDVLSILDDVAEGPQVTVFC